jgi:hypothetical protein
MYSTMWSLNIQLNSQFFAVACCMLSYMRTPIVKFFSTAVKSFANYMSAQKRIQVSYLSLEQIDH